MHSDLIAKLEALDGPSRELDALIATEIGGYIYEKRGRDQKAWLYPVDGGWRRQINGIGADKLPAYTTSLDAAVALMERVLPGWFWRAGKTSLFPKGWAYVSKTHPSHCDREDEASCADGRAENPAIALLIATIKALEARDG